MIKAFPGHNPIFLGMRNYLDTLSATACKRYVAAQKARNHSDWARLTIVANSLGRWSRQGIIAWDEGRVVMLCRWGALTGLLSEDDAWERIMAAARLVQAAYRNWYDYGWHYIAGRQFWQSNLSPEHASLQMSHLKKLLKDESGVWKQLPWETDLGAGANP